MATKNSDVVEAWARGHKAEAANLSTDGTGLYSYRLLIGRRMTRGGAAWLVIHDHTAGGGSYHSQTTSCHVGLAKRLQPYAGLVDFN